MELSAGTLEGGNEAARWRRAALLAGAVAGAELIVLLVVALAIVAKPFARSASQTRPKRPVATSTAASRTAGAAHRRAQHAAPRFPRSRTGVLVLNGNGETGAAAQKAIVVRSLDYPVVGTADASRRDVPRTIVMYRRGFAPEALRLARDLGLPRTRAVLLDGLRPSALHGAKLVLIVGRAA